MGRKYSRILSAAKYYASIDNYIKYITDATRRTQGVGLGTPRPPSKKLYIDPFAVELATGQVVQQSGSETAWNTYGSHFASRTDATPPTDGNLIILLGGGYKAARVSITTGRSATGTPKTSKVTGLKYLDYGGKSTSLPFGRANGTETEVDAFNTIRTALLAAVNGAIVTHIPEKI